MGKNFNGDFPNLIKSTNRNKTTNDLWYKTYEEMKLVEADKLYYPEFNSFTKWVNNLAKERNVHVSLLWSRYKAGKIYEEYFSRAKDNGHWVIPMAQVPVSPDNFILIDRIAGEDTNYADELIEALLLGKITRSTLRMILQQTKLASDNETSQFNKAIKGRRFESSVLRLLNKPSWLQKYINNDRFKIKYRLIPIHNQDTGDFSIIENLTSKYDDELHYHILLAKYSVSRDREKTLNYALRNCISTTNYVWVVAPKENVYEFLEKTPEWCGVISIGDEEQVEIERFAVLDDNANCEELMKYALYKLL